MNERQYIKSDLVTDSGALGSAEMIGPSSGGGEVTAAAVASAIGDMNSTQTAQALSDLGGEPQKIVVSVTKSGSNYSVDKTYAQINAAYQAGASVVFYYGGTAIANFDDSGVEDAFTAEICHYGSNGPELVMIAVPESDMVVGEEYLLQKVPTESTVSGTTPTITPVANNIYKCGELSSLAVSSPPATGAYSIVFTSGSTATTTTIPATILGLENFSAEANTMYEINVLDNRAVIGSWAVSST